VLVRGDDVDEMRDLQRANMAGDNLGRQIGALLGSVVTVAATLTAPDRPANGICAVA